VSPAASWRRALVVLGVALATAGRADAPPAHGGLAATRALVARLASAGRGEAAVTLTRSDPMGGPAQVERGRLALEPPDRARLDFPGSGERIAMRGDGGEWVQPATRQMVRLNRAQTASVAGLWELFLHGGNDRFTERAAGKRRFVLEALEPGDGLPERITVRLDTRGLPVALETDDAAGVGVRYAFGVWRFSRASGAPAFVLRPPAGFAVVDLP
jgi:outer membrane lipoprotein-sorting protein